VEIKLSTYAETLVVLLKERLQASEAEVIEEAIVRLFHESQGESEAQEVMSSGQPTPLIEVMDKSGLLD
jgi:hypothetical protein